MLETHQRTINSGRSTFNGWDHDQEIVGMCQPFLAKISVTELDAERFEEAQAPKHMKSRS